MKIWLVILALLAPLPALAQSVEPTPRELLAIINERTAAVNQRFSDSGKAVDAALSAAKDAVSAALVAAERATTKAELAQQQKNETQNEFRGQLKDQAATLASRLEVAVSIKALDDRIDVRLKSLEDKIGVNSQQITQALSRAEGAAQTWGYITAGVSIALAVLALFVTYRNRRPAA
jgi:hypothetical protein